MYSWLAEALERGAHIVTANLRLSRLLVEQVNQSQLEQGRSAWLRPSITDWNAWLSGLADDADPDIDRPVRVNPHQSRLLWEDCLLDALAGEDANLGVLVRQAREARQRLVDWQVPLQMVGEYARNADQRLFAKALDAYVARLQAQNWIDDAGFADYVVSLMERADQPVASGVVLAGFSSPSPLVLRAVAALRDKGGDADFAPPGEAGAARFAEYIDEPAELRAAGAWAREELEATPDAKIGIVVSGLEGKAELVASLVREGFVPGWQLSTGSHAGAVNVSYGRKLRQYPCVAVGLDAIRWLMRPLNAGDISVLLRSTLLGDHEDESRIRAELLLRELPDRDWSLDLFCKAFAQADVSNSLNRLLGALADSVATFATDAVSPRQFVELVDSTLESLAWPGQASIDSVDFQVINRWRELLNEFVRLSLVRSQLTPVHGIARLAGMADEVLFQPEQEGAAINVLGVLEASGSEFDKLWVAGMTARNWPPPSRPLALLSTPLQREYDMPDSSPANTLAYAERSLAALRNSTAECVLSMARFDGDAEQTRSALLQLPADAEKIFPDPGWFAAAVVDEDAVSIITDDAVPPIRQGDRVFGGASTIDRQASSPFDAFAFGRLRINYMPCFSPALSPILRGNLIHDALKFLYANVPDQAFLASLDDAGIETLCREGAYKAFVGQFRAADDVLRQVLRLEEERARQLLRAVVTHDAQRSPFRIAALELAQELDYRVLSMQLRADRIDALQDDSLMILDYKTGSEKKFLSKKQPASFQLVLYSLVSDAEVAALGLYNVDSRAVYIDGAGRALDDRDSWGRDLAEWTAIALAQLDRLIDGDVRVNAFQSASESRRSALLSRVAELRRD